jgi:hypothetical protein
MTREKAVQINHLLCKIEDYEALQDEIKGLQMAEDIYSAYGEDIKEELLAVVQPKLDKLLKELEDM